MTKIGTELIPSYNNYTRQNKKISFLWRRENNARTTNKSAQSYKKRVPLTLIPGADCLRGRCDGECRSDGEVRRRTLKSGERWRGAEVGDAREKKTQLQRTMLTHCVEIGRAGWTKTKYKQRYMWDGEVANVWRRYHTRFLSITSFPRKPNSTLQTDLLIKDSWAATFEMRQTPTLSELQLITKAETPEKWDRKIATRKAALLRVVVEKPP